MKVKPSVADTVPFRQTSDGAESTAQQAALAAAVGASDAPPTLLVNIDVADLEQAIEFYTVGICLTVRRRLGPSIVELLGASSPIFLTEQPTDSLPFAQATLRREYRRHWTSVHLDFVVHELEPAVRRAESAGARVEGETQEFAWGRYRVMADPFGNGFCLLQFLGRGYDEIASR